MTESHDIGVSVVDGVGLVTLHIGHAHLLLVHRVVETKTSNDNSIESSTCTAYRNSTAL